MVFAALLPDFLLGWLVLAGWETCTVPADYASGHYLLFEFPWSHGLVADLVWAAIVGTIAGMLTNRGMASAVVAVAVVSHFLLDGLVHVKGLPLMVDDVSRFTAGGGGPIDLGAPQAILSPEPSSGALLASALAALLLIRRARKT